MKKLLVALAVCFSTIQLNAQDVEPSIVGTWKYTGIDGIAEGDTQGRQLADAFFSSTVLVFTEAGTWSGNFMGAKEGKYRVSEDGKQLFITTPKEDTELPIKLESLTTTELKLNPGQSPGALVLIRE